MNLKVWYKSDPKTVYEVPEAQLPHHMHQDEVYIEYNWNDAEAVIASEINGTTINLLQFFEMKRMEATRVAEPPPKQKGKGNSKSTPLQLALQNSGPLVADTGKTRGEARKKNPKEAGMHIEIVAAESMEMSPMAKMFAKTGGGSIKGYNMFAGKGQSFRSPSKM